MVNVPLAQSTHPPLNSPMRLLTALLLLPLQAHAWEAYTDGPVCVLSNDTATHRTEVTHDPRRAKAYAMDITLTNSTWEAADSFAIRFDGPARLTITTNRHTFNGDQSTLSVADTGFGNVLDGLEFNHTANALLGDQTLVINLTGAAPEVRRFRDCTARVGA